MEPGKLLAQRFEENRTHLRAVAFRMLGSKTEAEDAVQEAWLRLNRADRAEVENLRAWLTTVVARVCLDVLRARKNRGEEPIEGHAPETIEDEVDLERETLLADSVGPALLVVLETLAPAERLAFVLHDLFAMPFEEIAQIVGRTEPAVRQLASRARRRVRGASLDHRGDVSRQREIVTAFLAAARGGDFTTLLSMLDPNVEVRPDATALKFGAKADLRGAENVAKEFARRRAPLAQVALIDGVPGAIVAPGGSIKAALRFEFSDSKVAGVEVVADPARLAELDVVVFGASP